MNVSYIIACRLELPENLERTVNHLANQPDSEVIVVLDGQHPDGYADGLPARIVSHGSMARGCGFSRDFGVNHALGDIIVFCDGHMMFPDNVSDLTVEAVRSHPRHVICSHMASVDDNWQPYGHTYAGAQFVAWSREDGGDGSPLSAKWSTEDIVEGQIGACMGAFYAMERQFYVKGMKRPLGVLSAWGGDEELLSLCSWFAMGGVWLVPWSVSHMYGAPHTRPPITQSEVAGVLAGRLIVAHLMQMENAADWLRPGRSEKLVDAAEKISSNAKSGAIADMFDNSRRTRAGFFKRHVTNLLENKNMQKTMNERSALRNLKTDAMRMVTPVAQTPVSTAVELGRANWGANEVPRRCVKCHAVNSSVTQTSTRRFPTRIIRWRECRECGAKYSTIDATR